MITVTNRVYGPTEPEWLKLCPHCRINYIDSFIELDSEGIYTHFALCNECRTELSDKLKMPTGVTKSTKSPQTENNSE